MGRTGLHHALRTISLPRAVRQSSEDWAGSGAPSHRGAESQKGAYVNDCGLGASAAEGLSMSFHRKAFLIWLTVMALFIVTAGAVGTYYQTNDEFKASAMDQLIEAAMG